MKLRLRTPKPEARSLTTFSDWLESFSFNGSEYYLQSQANPMGANVDIGSTFSSFVEQAYKSSSIVGAAVTARALLLSQLVFKWRRQADGTLFGSPALLPLERPAGLPLPQLLMAAEQHASLAGNAFFLRTSEGVRLLRPDWVTVVLGSRSDPSDPSSAWDAVPVGYVYDPPGRGTAPDVFDPTEVAHWAPEPDPAVWWRGSSWVQSVIAEIRNDRQANLFKSKFFQNGATPQMIVSFNSDLTQAQAEGYADMVNANHAGAANAYKTLFLGGGADVSVVGSNLSELSLQHTQGKDESRIALRSRVPAVVMGISEGMQGSALNAGNYGQTRRLWSDGWFTPYTAGLCACLERVLDAPAGAELAHDPSRVMFLQDDRLDEANILQANANTLRSLVDAGYDPSSAVAAIAGSDITKLTHSGLYSVQLQPTGSTDPVEPDADETDEEDQLPRFTFNMSAPAVNIHPQDIRFEPHVTAEPAQVTVEPPVVNIAPPEVTVERSDVIVNLPEPKPVRKVVERDDDGNIISIEERS